MRTPLFILLFFLCLPRVFALPLEIENREIKTKKFLNLLRKEPPVLYAFYLDYIRDAIGFYGVKYEAIETSKEELMDLEIKGCKATIKYYLKILNSKPILPEFYKGCLIEELEKLKKLGVSFENLNLSNEESEIIKNLGV